MDAKEQMKSTKRR